MHDDERWMGRALSLAARAEGRTAPNPMVGAVLVADGQLLAEGHHLRAGEAHAEVAALRALPSPEAARGATLYVNLEPCCHHGRTPPCTEAILRAGVARVVVGMVDPDSRMQGQGIAQLRAAGLDVQVGVLEAEARHLNRAFVSARTRGRPHVILKAAITLDGRIAAADGQSQWITGPEARAAGHALRDRVDAILVGSGTLLADDPALNTRVAGGRDALPVLLDRQLRCPPTAKVLRAGRPPLIFVGPDADLERASALAPARVLPIPAGEGGLDLGAALARLAEEGVHSLLVEGGARVHRAMVGAGVADELRLFLAPKLLAGGAAWLAGPPFTLAEAPRFRLVGLEQHGPDLELRYLRAEDRGDSETTSTPSL